MFGRLTFDFGPDLIVLQLESIIHQRDNLAQHQKSLNDFINKWRKDFRRKYRKNHPTCAKKAYFYIR